MKRNIVLLVSSAGRRVGLIDCFRADAARIGVDLRVLAADLDPSRSAACQIADAAIRLPRCSEPAYVPALIELCVQEHVDLVIPTIDPELPVLAAQRERLAEIGTQVAVSTPEVVAIARNKRATAQRLSQGGVPVPRTLSVDEAIARPESVRWPLVLKPVEGSSSAGLHIAEGPDDAKRLGAMAMDYIAQERWFGREFTVNLFFDAAGKLRCAVPHWRIETRGGEVSKGRTERVPVLEELATRIARLLPGARGALCFQAILTDDGRAAVFEINARFGGGYPLTHRAGARFSEWLLQETVGMACDAENEWAAGILMVRYDSAVYLHE